MQAWLETPAGRYLRAWEQQQFDQAVVDLFGYHALQLGLAEIDGLRSNRISHRWIATPQASAAPLPPRVALVADPAALPFQANSLDLVLLPHTLDLSPDPHDALREVERVLVPEGRVVICGLNPASLWGLRQRRTRLYERLGVGEPFMPASRNLISYRRLRDWLRLLSFEVESSRFGLYRPAMRSEAWLERLRWIDRLGDRWWPIFGALYFVVAVKRVRGMTLIGAADRRRARVATAPVPAIATGRMHAQPAPPDAVPVERTRHPESKEERR
ncbi:MAG: class I SAM-dependent methyltransferase [Comamonadaceae bacterium]|nr:MAG: class I SAM-dependent methyltransferase [Comamonadaceae bacterium]